MGPPGRFGAVICAMTTPFRADGSLDLPGAARLARWLVDNGNDGLVVAGTTGESTTLSHDEKIALWQAARKAVVVPLLAGTGTASTAESVALTKAAAECGADGALVVTPYYSRPSQAGIEAHFRAIAAATSLPIMAYDVPRRTGREISTMTLARLAADGVVVALKDAAASPAAASALLGQVPASFELYSGDDALTLPLLAVGAVGVVSVASHWAGPVMTEMLGAFAKGDTQTAAALNARLAASYVFEASAEAPSPVPSKAMLRALGLPAGECRLPLGPTPAGLEDRARQVWSELYRQPFQPVLG